MNLDHIRTWTENLRRSLLGLCEPRQRSLKVIRTLKSKSAEEIASFLKIVAEEALGPSRKFHQIHLDLIHERNLFADLGYELLSEVYRIAAEQGWVEVTTLLQSDRKSSTDREILPEGYAAKLNSFTLGERRALSRKRRRKDLELLMFDSDPRVIRELLKNPRLTERDVIRIAARHQASPSILEEVSMSRWIECYGVKKALAFNPATSMALAIGLLNHLTRKDVHLMVSLGTRRRPLLEAAEKRSRSRK